MTDQPQIGTGFTDIKVETNFTPAPVEQTPAPAQTQQSTETKPEPVKTMVTTEPLTPLDDSNPDGTESQETPIPAKPEVSADDKANQAAREAIQDRLRADDAERRLKELQPKIEVPDKEPNINDQASWGSKYKDSPNDLENFLKAHAEWAREDGKREERASIQQQQNERQQMATRTVVAQREQEARAKHADYDAVITPVVPIIGNMPILKDFIAKNPMGTLVAYELGKNPALLQTLMQSDMWGQGEQLLNMAARLKAPKPIEITQAPAPIKPVGSRETAPNRLTELASKDINGYIKTMNKRELAKKKSLFG